jgi:hypothetical protein
MAAITHRSAARRGAVEAAKAPDRKWSRIAVATTSVIALAVIAVIVISRGSGVSGTYRQADGTGSMEFRGSKVYITTVLGTTFVSNYEVDGNRVIIKGAGGSQVFTRSGDTLDGGLGIRFVRQGASVAAHPGD